MTDDMRESNGRSVNPSLTYELALCGAALGAILSCASNGPAASDRTRVATVIPGASAPADAASTVTIDAKPPDEAPAPRQFAAWLAVFNGGDVDAMMAYRKEHYTPELTAEALGADDLRGFRQETGGFELKKAEESSATRFVALVKERNSDQFARVTLEVAAEEPHRVSLIAMNAIPTPDDFRAPRMTEAGALGALRAEIAKAVAADRFSGAVLIARGGVPIFTGAYGLADRERKIPNKLDTRFRIGSMNKMFTATAILQLVQAGKLATSDTLAQILPDYPNKQLASKVTIHHLLTHTGGTGDIFGPEFDAHRLQLRTIRDYVKLYGARDLEFEPGARWQYSNYGFLLLAVTILANLDPPAASRLATFITDRLPASSPPAPTK